MATRKWQVAIEKIMVVVSAVEVEADTPAEAVLMAIKCEFPSMEVVGESPAYSVAIGEDEKAGLAYFREDAHADGFEEVGTTIEIRGLEFLEPAVFNKSASKKLPGWRAVWEAGEIPKGMAVPRGRNRRHGGPL